MFDISMGEALNGMDETSENLEVQVDLGQAEQFVTYQESDLSLAINSDLAEVLPDGGSYTIVVTLVDFTKEKTNITVEY